MFNEKIMKLTEILHAKQEIKEIEEHFLLFLFVK